MPNQHGAKVTPEVRTGQARRDKQGGTIIVGQVVPGGRYVCEYPQLDGETVTMSPSVITALYPILISE